MTSQADITDAFTRMCFEDCKWARLKVLLASALANNLLYNVAHEQWQEAAAAAA